MILYANGDSHSFGLGIKKDQTFCALTATRLGYQLINAAKSGASNARILRTTREYLANSIPDFVLIGWTTWEREEWFYDGHYYDVNSSGHDALPRELEQRYKTWVGAQTPDRLNKCSRFWHDEIWYFHLELQQKSVPHLFFNCMYNFFDVEHRDWQGCYVGPYDNDWSYYWCLTKRGHTSDKLYHFGQDGHDLWANILCDFIKNN